MYDMGVDMAIAINYYIPWLHGKLPSSNIRASRAVLSMGMEVWGTESGLRSYRVLVTGLLGCK